MSSPILPKTPEDETYGFVSASLHQRFVIPLDLWSPGAIRNSGNEDETLELFPLLGSVLKPGKEIFRHSKAINGCWEPTINSCMQEDLKDFFFRTAVAKGPL